MRILLATDAWPPQVNGVVRTLTTVTRELTEMGHRVLAVQPGMFRTLPCPIYPEIRLAIGVGGRIAKIIEASEPDAIHIATEGPIGIATRRWCLANRCDFSTAFHTRFPEYLAERRLLPASLTYAFLCRFHEPAGAVMVASDSIRRELASRGFRRLVTWGRGVNTEFFNPQRPPARLNVPRPIFLSVGRLAREKNLGAFLSLDLPGSKVVVGDGPLSGMLKRRFPRAHFLGRREGSELAAVYAAADVFVFPSRTDTFGLVMLEALASGLPIAAFPVAGPRDVLSGGDVGVLDDDLRVAALSALSIPHERCRDYALNFTWRACARQFLENLRPAGVPGGAAPEPFARFRRKAGDRLGNNAAPIEVGAIGVSADSVAAPAVAQRQRCAGNNPEAPHLDVEESH